MCVRPHDLLWIRNNNDLITSSALPVWVQTSWSHSLPVVVRRDQHKAGLIPVGIRGAERYQRFAAWISTGVIIRKMTPEQVVETIKHHHGPALNCLPIEALKIICHTLWPMDWGVTGSLGYSLATGLPIIHQKSDLDLLIRSPEPLIYHQWLEWSKILVDLPCHVDVQIEAPEGAFSLSEWLTSDRVLLKTNHGPKLVTNPWA